MDDITSQRFRKRWLELDRRRKELLVIEGAPSDPDEFQDPEKAKQTLNALMETLGDACVLAEYVKRSGVALPAEIQTIVDRYGDSDDDAEAE